MAKKTEVTQKQKVDQANKSDWAEEITPEMAAELEELSEEGYYLFHAPIAEFAKHEKIDIDEAVKRRVEAAVEAAPPKMEVNVRTIDPRGQQLAFASVNIGGVTVDGFKIFERKDNSGLFVGMPSRKIPGGGFQDTVRIDKDLREHFNEVVIDAYHAEGERLAARAAAIANKPRVAEQIADAKKKADKSNAERPAPTRAAKEATAER